MLPHRRCRLGGGSRALAFGLVGPGRHDAVDSLQTRKTGTNGDWLEDLPWLCIANQNEARQVFRYDPLQEVASC